MLLKVSRVRPTAQLPSRSNPSDAGADVFYCSPGDKNEVVVWSGDSRILPTGLKVEVPHGYMLEVKNRSGMAAKKSLVVGACVVDSGYNGEIFVNLHNIGNHSQTVKHGDKIAQLVLIPVVQWRSVEVKENNLYQDALTISSRGAGALGSTGE